MCKKFKFYLNNCVVCLRGLSIKQWEKFVGEKWGKKLTEKWWKSKLKSYNYAANRRLLPKSFLSIRRFNLVGSCVRLFIVVNVFRHLPDLHDVIFWYWADDPRLVGIPRKVGDLCSVSPVNEEKFWRSVFGIFSCLFFTNLRQVPDVKTTVSSAAGQNGFVMRRPLNLEDFVLVRLEWVKFQFQVAQIPQSNGLVGRSSGQDEFWRKKISFTNSNLLKIHQILTWIGIEAQAIDFSRVSIDSVRWFCGVVDSRVPDHQFLIVSDRSK